MTDYKDTLNLPKTDFPMRANLAQRLRAGRSKIFMARFVENLLDDLVMFCTMGLLMPTGIYIWGTLSITY